VLVEPGEVQWATHPGGVTSRADLPAPGELGHGPCVVLANELLDNLPFSLVERTAHGWSDVRVTVGPRGFVEVLEPLPADQARWCDARTHGDAAPGARLPIQADAAGWLAEALRLAAGGRVVVVDYASDSADLSQRPWAEWVRTYAAQGRAGNPLADPGTCDVTCEVAVDQLSLVRSPDIDEDQAAFLRAHGLDDLVAEGAARWKAEGSAGGLAAIAGRSRVHEADALTDPAGLGAFRVLEWIG
jgi:SAM-dependent MidA family methyltransferase